MLSIKRVLPTILFVAVTIAMSLFFVYGFFRCNSYSFPIFSVAESSLDLGLIEIGNSKKATIPIKNCGKGTLLIYRIERSCGCTDVKLLSNKVEPGDTIDLVVEVKGRASPKSIAIVSLSTNDPVNPIQRLLIKFHSKVGIWLDSKSLTFDISRNDSKEASSVRSVLVQSDLPLFAGELKISPDEGFRRAFSFTLEETEQREVKIDVATQTGSAIGIVRGQLAIEDNRGYQTQLSCEAILRDSAKVDQIRPLVVSYSREKGFYGEAVITFASECHVDELAVEIVGITENCPCSATLNGQAAMIHFTAEYEQSFEDRLNLCLHVSSNLGNFEVWIPVAVLKQASEINNISIKNTDPSKIRFSRRKRTPCFCAIGSWRYSLL